MDELERKIARAAIEAPPAANGAQVAARVAQTIGVNALTVELLLNSLCARQILTLRSAHAGNLAEGQRYPTLVKVFYEKGPHWRTYLTPHT
jgi:hypothetical protein